MARKATAPEPNEPTPSDVLRAVIAASKEPVISNAELARRTGMTRANISRVMSGEAPYPSVQTIEAILAAIKATLCDYYRAKKRIEKNTD